MVVGNKMLAADEATNNTLNNGRRIKLGFLDRYPGISLFFLGLGIYRAWIEIVYVGSFVDFPIAAIAGQNVFSISSVVTMLGCALLSKKIGSFFNQKILYVLCGTALSLSTIGAFASLFYPEVAGMIAFPSTILGGFGIGLMILFWSELYACLNPLKVALYYSASCVLAALIVVVCKGFFMPWLFGVALVMPALSLLCVLLSYHSLSEDELPQAVEGKFSFPWKPVLLMAVYAFAYGLQESSLYNDTFGPHSALGTVLVAGVVFIGVVAKGKRFDLGTIYRVALPLMVAGFLLLPSFGVLDPFVSNLCVSASYMAFSILMMLIMTSMSYRYGISAIWLFGIERGIRSIFSMSGRFVERYIDSLNIPFLSSDLSLNIGVILLVVICTVILLSENELSSRWGVTFLGSSDKEGDAALVAKQETVQRCREIAKRYKLSQREEEVLLLLAQKKPVSSIEKELVIANGTAKTHIKRIYRKLDIHSRDELVVLLENPLR